MESSSGRQALSQSAETRALTSQLLERSETPVPSTTTRVINALCEQATLKISGHPEEITIKSAQEANLSSERFSGPINIKVTRIVCSKKDNTSNPEVTLRDQVELSTTRKLIVTLVNSHLALVTPDEWNQHLAEKKALKASGEQKATS